MPFRTKSRRLIAPTMRFASLDAFAQGFPSHATNLLGERIGVFVSFGDLLFARLNTEIRQARGGGAVRQLATAFGELLQSSARQDFVSALIDDGRQATETRADFGRARSLWGLTPIINLIPCAEADRRIGTEAETVVLTTYHVTQSFNVVLKDQFEFLRAEAPQLLDGYRWALLTWAILAFDNFFLFNDRGFLAPGGYGSDRFGINLEEMRIIRAAKKQLYTMTYGADYRTRLKTMQGGEFNFCMECPEPTKYCLCDDGAGQKIFKTITEHATATLAIGLSADYLPKPRLLNFLVIDTDKIEPHFPRPNLTGRIRIAHSPNHGFFKGSKYLEQAVRQLREEGYSVDLISMTGKSNAEVLKNVAEAEIFADQFIGGSYGYAAVEAMALGKPVLCYVRDPTCVTGDSAPIINANPATLYQAIKALLDSPDRLRSIGIESRAFAVRYHSIAAFSQALRALYDETSPFASRLFGRAKARKLPQAMWLARQFAWQAKRCAGLLRARVRGIARRFAGLLLHLTSEILIVIARLLTNWRLHRGKPKTLWGVTPILTLPLLAECDRRLGLRSSSLVFTTYYIRSQFDINLKPVSEFLQRHSTIAYRVLPLFTFAYALLSYDVFHYFCDRGILPPRGRKGINRIELQILRRCNKRLYTYTYGADVRTRRATEALGKYNFCVDCPEPGRFCVCDDNVGRLNTSEISQYATSMIAMGDMLTYVPDPTELHFWPLDLKPITPSQPRRPEGGIRIVHAPNHTHFKGTRHLERAVLRLQAEGHYIELIRLQGLPNHEVLRRMADADIVAEQFIGGFHGYTALEAMALGKPVLCYIRDPERLADAESCPIINADPESLEQVLRGCLLGEYDLVEIGRRGRAYVENYYSIDSTALRLGRLYLTSAGFPAATVRRIESHITAIESASCASGRVAVSGGHHLSRA
jgi:hypothetical protein